LQPARPEPLQDAPVDREVWGRYAGERRETGAELVADPVVVLSPSVVKRIP